METENDSTPAPAEPAQGPNGATDSTTEQLAVKVEKLDVKDEPAASTAPVVDEPPPTEDESAIHKAFEALQAEDPRSVMDLHS
jgi:hypothetical protein